MIRVLLSLSVTAFSCSFACAMTPEACMEQLKSANLARLEDVTTITNNFRNVPSFVHATDKQGETSVDFLFRQFVGQPNNAAVRGHVESMYRVCLEAGAKVPSLQRLKIVPTQVQDLANCFIDYIFESIEKSDAKAVIRLLKHEETHQLLTPVITRKNTTLLHQALKAFDKDNPQSVQIFSMLMRAGAAYRVPSANENDRSVEQIITEVPGQHPAYYLFMHERNRREAAPSKVLNTVWVRRSAETLYEKLEPHKEKIVGAIGVVFNAYLAFAKKSSQVEYDSRVESKVAF